MAPAAVIKTDTTRGDAVSKAARFLGGCVLIDGPSIEPYMRGPASLSILPIDLTMSRPPLNPEKSVAGIALDPQTLERVIPESKRPDGTYV